MQIQIFYSYACRDTYKVFSWLECVQQQGMVLDIAWRPFGIEIAGELDWSQPFHSARSELRGFIAAEAAKQQGAFLPFHRLLERAVHESYLELGDPETLLNVARRAGLDVEKFRTAISKPDLAELAWSSHQQGVNEFNIFGTPTLVVPPNHTMYLELKEIPTADHASKLFDTIYAMTVTYPYAHQLKRTM